ncbi:gp53-like domain-containing protein [Phascolarctobacterium faecium]
MGILNTSIGTCAVFGKFYKNTCIFCIFWHFFTTFLFYLQWGENVGGGGQTVSLPISFEVAFTAVVSADSSWCNASCHITTTTITTMNYQSNRPDIAQAGPVQWLAIGI